MLRGGGYGSLRRQRQSLISEHDQPFRQLLTRGEMAYFNSQMPKYGILKKRWRGHCGIPPFKGEMEKEFGSNLLQNMEAQKQLSDECIVDDQVEGSRDLSTST